ncbi:MAG: helix-turn-helix domain-containing protein [Nanoarchaeota archaeon]
MAKKNFILLSMEDSKIKKISNVISNDSCRKILDYLANKEATESELASKLDIPISTVHYNLQQLMGTGLIDANEYHYSEKGKEVNHYRLANKYIIIAPKNVSGIKEKLRSILPAVLIVSGAALIIQLVNNYFSKSIIAAQPMMAAADAGAAKVASASMQEAAVQATQQAQTVIPNIALWFLAGAIFALLVYFIIGLMEKNKD